MAWQIASEVKYLSPNQIVYRNLARRNRLISTKNYQLHITDIAMGKSEYFNDYARVEWLQSFITLRWAAWESKLLNQFSFKSDVWPVGITLYELLTYPLEQ